MIHVCYGLYDRDGRYSKFTATSMISLFENNSTPPPSVIVHILHDYTLTQESRDKFNYIAGKYGQVVKFYNVEILCPEKIAEIRRMFENAELYEHFSIGTAFRLAMTDLIDVDKIIYLDSDTIVNLDIKELWQIELEEKPFAAVSEFEIGIDHSKQTVHSIIKNGTVNYRNYFCAGVLMVSLKYLKKHAGIIENAMNFVFESKDCNYFDQDVLNYCFAKNYVHLPEKFDAFIDWQRLRRLKIRPAIYHFENHTLNLNSEDIFNQLWIKYFAKTPFFNENTVKNLYEGVQQLNIQQKKFALNISEIMAGKMREFFIAPADVDAIKNIFRIKTNEEIIFADSQQSLQKLINAMKNSNGKKVFFLAIREFFAVQQILARAGFTPNKDFVNAFEFLSDAEGVPLNSHFMIKLL